MGIWLQKKLFGDYSDPKVVIVLQEQLRISILDLKFAGLGVVTLFAIALYALWGHIPNFYIIVFLTLFVVEIAWKLPLWSRYNREYSAGTVDVHEWTMVAWAATLYSGIVYGLSFLVVFLPMPPGNLLVVTIVAANVIFICVNVAVDMPSGASLQYIVMVLPVFVGLLITGDFWLKITALTIVVSGLVVISRSNHVSRRLADLIIVKDENDRLFQHLATEKEEAEQYRAIAENAIVEKSKFIETASHDLRQPLHALGLFQVALRNKADSPEMVHIIDSMEKSTLALQQLFTGLLDVSRLDAGVIEPEIGPYSLESIFDPMFAEFYQIAKKKDIEFRITHNNLAVHTDPILLERVVRNLIVNAMAHTDQGHVWVNAEAIDDKHMELSISDTGTGISQNHLSTIFTEFYKVKDERADEGGGFGLGLAIVKRICQLLDTNIEVTSELGKGSMFKLTMTLANVPYSAIAPAIQIDSINIENRKVLVIDDDPNILEGMHSALSEWGCEISLARSSSQALDIVTSGLFVPDIVLCDYQLGDAMNGVETSKRLRQQLSTTVAFIIITGDSKPYRIQEITANGFELLQKPVSPAALKKAMLMAL